MRACYFGSKYQYSMYLLLLIILINYLIPLLSLLTYIFSYLDLS